MTSFLLLCIGLAGLWWGAGQPDAMNNRPIFEEGVVNLPRTRRAVSGFRTLLPSPIRRTSPRTRC